MIAGLVTEDRAARVARILYPDQVSTGADCKAEIGRVGQPCRVCAEQAAQWRETVQTVRDAMMTAFS